MSRTIRRKTTKPSYFNFESEEKFNFALESHKSNAQKPNYIRPHPERPQVRRLSPWGRMQWVEAPYSSKEYEKHSQLAAEWWYEYRTSDAYLAYNAATEYKRYGFGKQSYKEFVAKVVAIHHSDCGYGVHKQTTPRDFRNGFTREDRQRTRALIHIGTELDNWDDLLFPKPKKDAGWWYW